MQKKVRQDRSPPSRPRFPLPPPVGAAPAAQACLQRRQPGWGQDFGDQTAAVPRASSADLSLPKFRGLPAWPGAGADGRRGPFQLQGCGSQAFPTPSPPGPPRRQTATAVADKPVAVDRGCLRPRGRARRGLCLAAVWERHRAPPRLPLGLPPIRNRRPWEGGKGCAWEKGHAAALGAAGWPAPHTHTRA